MTKASQTASVSLSLPIDTIVAVARESERRHMSRSAIIAEAFEIATADWEARYPLPGEVADHE